MYQMLGSHYLVSSVTIYINISDIISSTVSCDKWINVSIVLS